MMINDILDNKCLHFFHHQFHIVLMTNYDKLSKKESKHKNWHHSGIEFVAMSLSKHVRNFASIIQYPSNQIKHGQGQQTDWQAKTTSPSFLIQTQRAVWMFQAGLRKQAKFGKEDFLCSNSSTSPSPGPIISTQQDKHSIDSKHIKCHHKKFVHVLISFPFKKIKSAENMFEILICESHLNGFFVSTLQTVTHIIS